MHEPFGPFTRPPDLTAGDDIALVAPAGAYAAAPREAGCAWLRGHGFRIVPEAHMQPHFALAGPLDARVQSMRTAIAHPAPCIWTVRAGSGSGRVIPALEPDFSSAMAARPRWFVGFSDVTALHARAQASRVMSLHAANITTIASWTPAHQGEMRDLLTGKQRKQEFAATPVFSGHEMPTYAVGPLVGGNLTVLASLVGCNILPSWEGAIVLLEDIDERPYRLARALGQLIDSGAFYRCAGVVLGQFTRCDDLKETDQAHAWMIDALGALEVPILRGIAVGHDDASRPIVLGGLATMYLDEGRLEVQL